MALSLQLGAREKLKVWQDEYNHHKPHASLGNLTPSELVNSRSVQPAEAASLQFRIVRFPGERHTAKLRSVAQSMLKTLTHDQGKEMGRHAEQTTKTDAIVYFCDPDRPGQPGSCENTNGLICQFPPKDADSMLLPTCSTTARAPFLASSRLSASTKRS